MGAVGSSKAERARDHDRERLVHRSRIPEDGARYGTSIAWVRKRIVYLESVFARLMYDRYARRTNKR
jgi:hypothetical protein